MGDSDRLFVGQRAIAIGNPFGQEWTMTTGIVSALGRTMPSGNSPYSIPEMIQTDAAINPGNSGGPLLNAQGEVVGVATMIMSGSRSSAGVGFAVPANIVRLVVPVLIERGQYVYSWMGLQGTELSLDLTEAMALPPDTRGALVVSVVPGGPAEQAGLRGSDSTVVVDGAQLAAGGDVITAIEGRPATSMEDIIVYLVKETRPGDQVTLTILRDNGEQTLVVNLAERPHTTQP
jgi:S1-C subfamily serine protease